MRERNGNGATAAGGTIGVLSGDLTRYSDFVLALMHQTLPPGSKMVWTRGADVVGNMNQMVRGMVGEWLWILGDDHVFDGNLLQRLLVHDVDVVVPLCLKRLPPYDPVVYSHQNEDGLYVGYTDLPAHGLVPVHAAGSAGMLVKRYVFDALTEPMFESHGGLNEDLTFCAKVREAGFQIWCDVDSTIGHIGQVSVWPKWHEGEGEWQIMLHLGNGEIMPMRRVLQPDLVPA
jgi:hypothetical protein